MNPRKAVKETLRFLFGCLKEYRGASFSEEQIETAIEIMHDDDFFLEELLNFFEEHLEEYGENLGL